MKYYVFCVSEEMVAAGIAGKVIEFSKKDDIGPYLDQVAIRLKKHNGKDINMADFYLIKGTRLAASARMEVKTSFTVTED